LLAVRPQSTPQLLLVAYRTMLNRRSRSGSGRSFAQRRRRIGLLLSAAASPRQDVPPPSSAFEQVLASFDGVGPTGSWHWRLT
jgi:hypothetical protein